MAMHRKRHQMAAMVRILVDAGPVSKVTSMKSREVVRYVDSLDSLSSELLIRYMLTVLQADISVMGTELSSFSDSAVTVCRVLRSADRGRINQIYGVI